MNISSSLNSTCPKFNNRKPNLNIRMPSFKRINSMRRMDSFDSIVNFSPITARTEHAPDLPKHETRVFPQYFPERKRCIQDKITGLRSYKNQNGDIVNFVYHDDLQNTGVKELGTNAPEFVKLCNNHEYIYKKSFISTKYLPKTHSRHSEGGKYYSHSRVMMQIMSRNLLELFLENKNNDILLPKMYPVVHREAKEVCGLISRKIECDDYASLSKKLNAQEISQKEHHNHNIAIEQKIIETNVAVLAKIIGVDDLVHFFKTYKIRNVGITPDKKLVLFDFGCNMLDYEYHTRHKLFKKNDDYDFVLLQSDSNPNPLKNTVDTYLENYHTLGYHSTDDITAKFVHPDIEKIVMTMGPSNIEFRTKLAKLIQTRINNAVLQTQKT